MPSRKQRRKREKLQRHEYEYVIETEEGEEVQVDRFRDVDLPSGQANGSRKEAVPSDRRGKPMQKPSVRKALRRGLILAPLLFAFVYFTAGKELKTIGIVLNTLVLLAFFIPFTYLLDSVIYRSAQRRQERARSAKR